jgi:hypothetical protein
VALVLAVLTVNISPAGRTVRLLSSTYQKRLGYKVDFVVGGLQRGFLAPTLKLDSLSLLSVNTTATFGPAGLSARLGQLQRRSGTRSSRRYGALQFNDTVGANITVDWTWVRANLPFILQNQALIEGAAALAGVNLNLNNELLSSVNANVQIPAGFNVTNFLDTNNITDASTATARKQAGVNVTVSSVSRAHNGAHVEAVQVQLDAHGAVRARHVDLLLAQSVAPGRVHVRLLATNVWQEALPG